MPKNCHATHPQEIVMQHIRFILSIPDGYTKELCFGSTFPSAHIV